MREGAILGSYVLGSRLGDGGMAEVWAATHVRGGHPLAIKVSHASVAGAGVARRAFQDEVRAIAALDHPSVVRIYDQGVTGAEDVGAVQGLPWLAMERARGTLASPVDWEALRNALLDVLDALSAAHAIGILHLDVKPSNVLVREDGSHALADFGIVMLRGALGSDPCSVSWGSPAYMAPERFDGRPERLTEATDLYAVGCMAFHLASQRTPFSCPTWDRAATAHRTAPTPDLFPRIPVAPGFGSWVRTLLAKRPGDRFATASDARRALASLGPAAVELAAPTRLSVETALTATLAGEPVPVAELVVADPRPVSSGIPDRWALVTRARRHESVGVGLLGLLSVPFVGRDDARRILWEELGSWSRGGPPGLVALVGPRGAGRTRLGEAFAAAAGALSSALVLRIPGGPEPVRSALRHAIGADAELPEERVREAAALRLCTPPHDPVIDSVVRGLSGSDPASALLAVATSLAAHRVVVVWADDVLRDESLVDAVCRLRERVLVVASASDRDRSARPDLAARLAPAREIPVPPLDRAAARELLADWVGLGPELVADLAERCEGDVALALEMVREGVRVGRLVQGSTGLEAADPSPLPFPEGAVAAWAAALPDPVTPGLERAAVLGRSVDRERLARALGDAGAAREVEALALERGLGFATDDGWTWASPALRQAILAGCADRLAEHHLACASACSDSERWARGVHRLAAGRVEDAVVELFAASHEVIAAGRMSEAARLLDRVEAALVEGRVADSNPAWGRLWRARGDLGPTHQGFEVSRAANERAVELARNYPGDPAWLSVRRNAVGGLAWLANVQLLPRLAKRWIDEEAELFEGKPAAGHLDHLGWYALAIDDVDLAVRSFTEARDLAAAQGLRYRRLVCDASLAIARCRADSTEGLAPLEAAGNALLEAGYFSARADIANALGEARRARGEPAAALAHHEEALRATDEGEARADLGFRVGYALALRDLGQYDRAVAELDACLRLLGDEGPSWAALVALHRTAVAVGRGDPVALEGAEAAAEVLVASGYLDPDVRASARVVSAEAARRGDPTARSLATLSAPRSSPAGDRDPRA